MSRAVQFKEYGSTSVLSVVDVPEPSASTGQVRVRVKSAGVNPFDAKVRAGLYQEFIPLTLPSGQGNEFAGVIDQVGEGVSGFAVGDEVMGSTFFAAQADYLVTDTSSLARKPASLAWDIAGGIPLAGQTAWYSVESLALTSADTVLVSAAAGGVGVFAAQLALRAGATVIGTASAANHDFLRSIGVIPVSYGEGLVERIRAAAPGGITAVLDNHGRETIDAGLALGVSPQRINTIVDSSAHEELGVGNTGNGAPLPAVVEVLAGYIAEGTFTVPLQGSYQLDQVVAAYDKLEGGHLRGKIVLVTE